MISSFTKWSRERTVSAQWNTLALVLLCFTGFLMPTSGQGQVWIDDLIGRPAQSGVSPTKFGEIAKTKPGIKLEQDGIHKAFDHGIEVQVEDLVLRSVEVRTFEGQLLYRQTGISEAEVKYDLARLAPGPYVITTESSAGTRQTKVSFVE